MKFSVWSSVLLLCCLLANIGVRSQCTHSIAPDQTDINGAGIAAGDTICLLAGSKNYLHISHLVGSAAKPIVIINRGGAVKIETNHFFGIKFSHCQHVKLLGNGNMGNEYGIQVLKVENGAGISVDEMSKEIEIAHVEVAHTKVGGIYAKTDPDCTFAATREKFTLTGLAIHHCYIHDIGDEGMYIGSSKYTGQHLTDCDTIVLPHLIHNVRIHDNIVERTGWDGIQVSSSPVDCYIYNNIIHHDSYRETPNQMSGILIGGGSDCDCYNNQIVDGKGDGIDVFGYGEMKFYNNLIIRAGASYQPNVNTAYRHGIFVGNAPDSAAARIKIMHNTIISPKSTGVRFFNTNTSNNLFFNNIISNPGSYGTMGNNAYLNTDGSNATINGKQNIFTEHPEVIGFVNTGNDEYDLLPGSRAVNAGFNAGLNNVGFDILDRHRPHNGTSDIGAYECQAVDAELQETETQNIANLHPNPSNGKFWLNIVMQSSGRFTIRVFNPKGMEVAPLLYLDYVSGINSFEMNFTGLEKGIYFLMIQSENKTIRTKFILD